MATADVDQATMDREDEMAMVNLTVGYAGEGEGARLAGDVGHTVAETTCPPTAAPCELGDRGRQLWAEVVAAYELTPTDVAILLEACRTSDELDRLQHAASELPELTTKGSRGQTVGHPLLAEVRAHRQLLDRLVAALGLEDGAE